MIEIEDTRLRIAQIEVKLNTPIGKQHIIVQENTTDTDTLEGAVPKSIRMANSSDARTRRKAVKHLEGLRDEKGFVILLELARSDHSKAVRAEALQSVLKLRSLQRQDRIVKLLISLIFDSDWRISRLAAKTLGDLGAVEAIKPLQQALARGKYDNMSEAAISLYKIGNEVGEDFITPLINDNSVEYDIKYGAIIALGVSSP